MFVTRSFPADKTMAYIMLPLQDLVTLAVYSSVMGDAATSQFFISLYIALSEITRTL
jgi:hypothetical protein